MSTTTTTDRYDSLTRRFPLRPIKDDAGLDAANAILHELISRATDDDEDDYLVVLSLLIKDYEDTHHPMPPVSEADILKHLIESRGTTAEAVAEATGIGRATQADVMEGIRRLSRSEIEALAHHFKVRPSIFFD